MWIGNDGVICWYDHGAGAGGTVVDALAHRDRISPKTAIRQLLRSSGVRASSETAQGERRCPQPVRDQEPPVPVPDQDALAKLVATASERLRTRVDVQERRLAQRGIPVDTAIEHSLGFAETLRFAAWPGRVITNVWTIPIPAENGAFLAVKLHREDPPKGEAKCLWAPLGTSQDPRTSKRRHSFSTLYPPPESMAEEWGERAAIMEFHGNVPRDQTEKLAGQSSEWVYLCPGELKALAVLGAGKCATSPTAGESIRWIESTVRRLRHRRVCIVYDDDEAGHQFRDNTISALETITVDIKAITFGRKESVA